MAIRRSWQGEQNRKERHIGEDGQGAGDPRYLVSQLRGVERPKEEYETRQRQHLESGCNWKTGIPRREPKCSNLRVAACGGQDYRLF